MRRKVEKSQIRVKAKVVGSSCPTENRQRGIDAARAVPPSAAKIKIPVQRVQKKIEILQSQLAQETMRSGIRRMKLEKTFEEQGTLSQAVVRNVNEAARDPEGNGDVGRSRTPQRRRRPAEGNQFCMRKATRLRQC